MVIQFKFILSQFRRIKGFNRKRNKKAAIPSTRGGRLTYIRIQNLHQGNQAID